MWGCRESGGKAVLMQDLGQPELLFESPVDAHFFAKHCSSPALGSCVLSPLPSIVQEMEPVGPKENTCLVVEVQCTKLKDTDLYHGLKIKKLKPKML